MIKGERRYSNWQKPMGFWKPLIMIKGKRSYFNALVFISPDKSRFFGKECNKNPAGDTASDKSTPKTERRDGSQKPRLSKP